MLPKSDLYHDLIDLNFNLLKNSFGEHIDDLSILPPLIVNSKSSVLQVTNEFSISDYLQRLSANIYSGSSHKPTAELLDADDTNNFFGILHCLISHPKKK